MLSTVQAFQAIFGVKIGLARPSCAEYGCRSLVVGGRNASCGAMLMIDPAIIHWQCVTGDSGEMCEVPA